MGHDYDLFTRFTRSLSSLGETPLSEEQFELLISNRGAQWIGRTLADADAGVAEPIEGLKKWASVARLTDGLGRLGLPVDLRGAVQLVREHGHERVMSLLTNARKNQDPNHHKELARMVNAILDSEEQGPPQEPPGRDAQAGSRAQPAQSRRLGQMPPPPGVVTRPAFDRQGEARPRAGGATVSQFPAGGRRQREEETFEEGDAPPPARREARRDGQAPAGRDTRRDRGQDDRKPEYDSATAYNRGGKGCAVRFQNATDDRVEGRVRHVVFAESAPIDPNTRKTYQWEHKKVVLMLNEAETEQVLMVLYGLLDSARFTAHGKDKKGWMNISMQDPRDRYAGGVQVQMGRGDGTYTTNIFPTQLSPMRMVVLRAYQAMMRLDSQDAALRHLQLSARSYAVALEQNPPQPQSQQRGRYASR